MGIDLPCLEFLLKCRKHFGDFGSTIVLGRQQLWLPNAAYRKRVLATLRAYDPAATLADIEAEYADRLFGYLGSNECHVMDNSSYEGAQIIHDLNLPLPQTLHHRYCVAVDSGTLEHVFNIPMALQSLGQMVRVGGRALSVNIANNYLGHGFWQFSPEAYFRVFSPENGWEPELAFLHHGGQFHELRDPELAGRRLQLSTSSPTYVLFAARKVEERPFFAQGWPIQSDYKMAWIRFRVNSAVREGDYDLAERVLRHAIANSPRNPFYQSALSAVMRKLGKLSEADSLSRNAHAAAPDNLDVVIERATVLTATKRGDEAVIMLEIALESWPRHSGLHTALGDAFAVLGRNAPAKTAFQTALEITPGNAILRSKIEKLKFTG